MKKLIPKKRTLSYLWAISLITCSVILGGFLIISLVFIGWSGYIYYQISQGLRPSDELRFLDRSPEAVFQSRFMDGRAIPSEVSEIHGIEGSPGFGESVGPAYIRFNATDSFISEMVTKDYGKNGKYVLAPCSVVPFNDNYTVQFPEKSEWWQPSEVIDPVCYSAHTCTLYDEKFLLIDTDNNIVYFYRTPICGLCPSGQIGAELRESERCQ